MEGEQEVAAAVAADTTTDTTTAATTAANETTADQGAETNTAVADAAVDAAACHNADIAAKICSLKLIHLVRRNEVLYNSDADRYTDKNHKDAIWERIYKQLFPKYATFNEELKETIRANVRRRWKTLRNSIAREVKKSATIENYCRKKESPIIAELEFLIPHIKSAHCAKLADELGLRENYTFMPDPVDTVEEEEVELEEDEETEEEEEEECNEMIDLTEETDIKPKIKLQVPSESSQDNSPNDTSNDSLPPEVLYPAIQMNTHEPSSTDITPTGSVPLNNWTKAYCSLAQYNGDIFTNSTNVVCVTNNQETEELLANNNGNATANEDDRVTEDSGFARRASIPKRRRIELSDSGELHDKLLELLNHQDMYDEDRMFLLSLVSDLKRVPTARKMLVKADIATAIARAIQP